jgi:hypothetical protein
VDEMSCTNGSISNRVFCGLCCVLNLVMAFRGAGSLGWDGVTMKWQCNLQTDAVCTAITSVLLHHTKCPWY